MDVSMVPSLVQNTGWPLVLEKYDTDALVYPRLGEVLPVDDATVLGEKGQTITGMGRPKRVEHGQEIQADQFGTGHTWYLKTHKFAHRIDLDFELIRSANAAGRIANIIAEQTASAVANAMITKEDYIADMFQKGTLTAGDLNFFDGRFPNELDPNPKLIYDALPWFDTAHTITGGSSTYSNHTVSGALSQANLEAQDTLMSKTSAFDDRDERISIRPTTLLVPTGATAFTASTLLESLLKPGSANNDANSMLGKYELIPWAALDDSASASSWWLGVAGKGLRIRDSGAPQIGTFIDEKKEVVSVKWVSYFGATVTDWRFWSCANKAAS